ncbi:MAG: hypothetical protein DIU52_012120 [bacterium]|jgi:hypothetical protein
MRCQAGPTRAPRLLLAAALLGVLGRAAASDGSSGEAAELSTEEVLATLQALDEAVRQKDTATIAAMLTDNYAHLSSRGGVRSPD